MRRNLAPKSVAFVAGGLLLLLTSVSGYADGGDPGRTSPYAIPSRCEPLAGELAGSPCEGLLEETCVTLPACWWRDTTAQNAITESAESQFIGAAVPAYQSTNLSVWVYSPHEGPNVIVLVSGTQYFVVGAGASDNVRDAARAAFAAAIPGFADMTLAGIFYPNAAPGSYGSSWTSDPSVPVYVNTNWISERQLRNLALAALGSLLTQVGGCGLSWGSDGLLGVGTVYAWDPAAPTSYGAPNTVLSNTSPTSITFNGVSAMLVPSGIDEHHYLYLPVPRIVILGRPFGPYFPDVAPLDGKGLPLGRAVQWINTCLALNPNVLVLQHGLPVLGNSNAVGVLTAWRDALHYVHTETLRRMNAGEDVDSIAATLTLQEPLASNPWVQPLATTVGGAVRSTYAFYLGGYGGRPATLGARGLTPAEEALRLVADLGGPVPALARARLAFGERTPQGTKWALRLTDAVIRAEPPEALVTPAYCLYLAALRQIAFSTPSAPERNLLLTEAEAVDLGAACVTDTDEDGTPDWFDPDDLPCNDPETCDGVDNDCNGQTDEGLPESPPECDDSDVCTADRCVPESGCAHLPETDSDEDGLCDLGDPDDDNDGVADGDDSAPLDPTQCRDTDGDTCDDCTSGGADPANDGPDEDQDGHCDAGDLCTGDDGAGDDDADGVCNDLDQCPADPDKVEPGACGCGVGDWAILGDVDGSGLVSSGDAMLAFEISIGSHLPTAEEFCAADCNVDGVVSSGDALGIFQTSLGAGACGPLR